MKIYSIGRGESNTIHVDNEFVSRQHALLKVYSSGKMEIIDKSSNGTAINGRKLKPNVPYRVRRKDVVTFAGQAHLDWKEIPDPLKGYKIAALCLLAALLLLGGFFALKPYLFKGGGGDSGFTGGGGGMAPAPAVEQPADTTAKDKKVDVSAELKKWMAREKRKEEERKNKDKEKGGKEKPEGEGDKGRGAGAGAGAPAPADTNRTYRPL